MLRSCALFVFLLVCPITLFAQAATTTSSAEAEVRETIKKYDDALRKGDPIAVGNFWAKEYVFINPRGEKLTRADRLLNVESGQTNFNSLEHAPKEEQIQIYGNGEVAVYTTLLTIAGQYGGKGQEGLLRGLVVWVHRDGRWQQTASQLTPVVGRQ